MGIILIMRSFPTPKSSQLAAVLASLAAVQMGCKGPLDDEEPLAGGSVPLVGQPVAGAGGEADATLEPNAIDTLLGDAVAGGAAPTPAADDLSAMPTIPYTIQKGDSLSKIAGDHGTDVATLQKLNGLTGSFIRYGDTLKVPAPADAGAGGAVPAPGATPGEGALSAPGELGTVPAPGAVPEVPTPAPEAPPTPPTPTPRADAESRLDGSGLGFGGSSAPRPRTPPRTDNEFLSPQLPE